MQDNTIKTLHQHNTPRNRTSALGGLSADPFPPTPIYSLAQAKTGTGKTLAFCIPSIELLLRSKPQPAPGQISILILSPTRELAIQIEEAARGLLSGTNYAVQHVSPFQSGTARRDNR